MPSSDSTLVSSIYWHKIRIGGGVDCLLPGRARYVDLAGEITASSGIHWNKFGMTNFDFFEILDNLFIPAPLLHSESFARNSSAQTAPVRVVRMRGDVPSRIRGRQPKLPVAADFCLTTEPRPPNFPTTLDYAAVPCGAQSTHFYPRVHCGGRVPSAPYELGTGLDPRKPHPSTYPNCDSSFWVAVSIPSLC
jgi:hypothetical protein